MCEHHPSQWVIASQSSFFFVINNYFALKITHTHHHVLFIFYLENTYTQFNLYYFFSLNMSHYIAICKMNNSIYIFLYLFRFDSLFFSLLLFVVTKFNVRIFVIYKTIPIPFKFLFHLAILCVRFSRILYYLNKFVFSCINVNVIYE